MDLDIMSSSELKITEDELDIAFDFIKREGFSYYFPDPFEIDAIEYSWDEIRPELSKINLTKQGCCITPTLEIFT